MQDNIPATIQQLNQMTGALTPTAPGLPLLIAMDEEGCQVKRLAADTFACAKQLSDQPISATYSAFRQRSELLHSSGINLNFGVIADITSDRQSFIYPRVFGSDPLAVSARVAAAVQGSHPATLITIKHFPGHGETPANSHSTIPQIDVDLDTWRSADAIPFQGGIDAGADVVMFGHLTYSPVDGVPATLSRRWHDILTNDMGFQGVSVTDDMVMLQQSGIPAYADPLANAVKALNAGNTMLLFVNDHGSAESAIDVARLIDGLVAAVNRGEIDGKIIDKNVMKVLQLRIKAAAMTKK